jgi:hypothetical protein
MPHQSKRIEIDVRAENRKFLEREREREKQMKHRARGTNSTAKEVMQRRWWGSGRGFSRIRGHEIERRGAGYKLAKSKIKVRIRASSSVFLILIMCR